jgi:hypothetical protein
MKEKLTNKDTSSIEKLIKAIKVLWTTNMSRTYLKNPEGPGCERAGYQLLIV